MRITVDDVFASTGNRVSYVITHRIEEEEVLNLAILSGVNGCIRFSGSSRIMSGPNGTKSYFRDPSSLPHHHIHRIYRIDKLFALISVTLLLARRKVIEELYRLMSFIFALARRYGCLAVECKPGLMPSAIQIYRASHHGYCPLSDSPEDHVSSNSRFSE